MLQKKGETSKIKKGIVVAIMLCLFSATTVFAVTTEGKLVTGLNYTWTGTYQDGILKGTTKASINTDSRSYNEVRLYKEGSGVVKRKTVHGNETGRKNVSTSQRFGTGIKGLRVYHTTANRGTSVIGNGFTASASGASLY